MKKWIAALLPVLILLLSAPPAFAAGTDAVIDMHGAKTYLGLTSDWSKAWNEDNFEEVTGDDVPYSGNVTVKAGTVGNITLGNSGSKLLVQGGTVQDVECEGAVEVRAGTVRSVSADGDVKISGGSIRYDVESSGEVTLSGTVSVGGNLTAHDVTVSSGAKASLGGTITADGVVLLNSCALKTRGIAGEDSGTLELNKYTAVLPPLTDLESIVVDGGTTAQADEKITAGSLYIKDGAEFVTKSSLDLNYLEGPGTLYFHSGTLTVHDGVRGKPLLVFSNSVGNGTTIFYADHDTVSEDDVKLYDYEIEIDDDGDEDRFTLSNSLSDGITLGDQSLSIAGGGSAVVKARVNPGLSAFAKGTKVVWELYGDTSAFTKAPDAANQSCRISVPTGVTGMHKATLIAYLVDSRGDRLEDYRSDSCVLSTGYGDDSNGSSPSDLTLDTTTVSILTGDRYWVLARTYSSVPPHAMSYNSAVATIGAPTAAKDRSGNPGWIYPVTGAGKGQVTIDIAGQKMITSVSAGITVDTSAYTMAPGGRYVVGIAAKGIDEKSLQVYSNSPCVSVQSAGRSGNLLLYRLTGVNDGTAVITYAISGGESVRTAVTVRSGASAGGVSSRLVALA